MSVTLTVDSGLTNYIQIQGFIRRQGEPDSEKEYYSNNIGAQIKINTKTKMISFLNANGYVLGDGILVHTEHIDYFAKHGEL